MTDKLNQLSYQEYIGYFNERVKKYIPPRREWTPVDKALFSPDDLYRIPIDEARNLQLSAIQFTFSHHYHNNELYRNFCKQHKISPEDIKISDDLTKIPLIPDTFFKNYPSGKEFAAWLGNIFTGDLPSIVIKQKNPSHDQVVEAFNAAGLVVTYSSGTGGRHTFIPRDSRTFYNSEYALAKSILAMSCGRSIYDSEAYLMMPDPRINSIFAGKTSQVLFDIVRNSTVAINQKLSLELLNLTMRKNGGIKGKLVRLSLQYKSKRMIANLIDWLIDREKSEEFTFILGAPYLINMVLQRLKDQGKSFNFGERGGVVTGGGWKIYENGKLSVSDFRANVYEVLGIPEKYCLDVYGMVEGNGWMIQCPEGHYLHVPHSYFKPLVLDDNLIPLEAGKTGRFAFLDASALSYPGFIITGDQVRLLEKCPACDRLGPVLEPEIKRAAGQDDRGCAGEVRRMFSST